jgi:hypothetical protein
MATPPSIQPHEHKEDCSKRRRQPNSSWRSQILAGADRIELELCLATANHAGKPKTSDPSASVSGGDGAVPAQDRAAVAQEITRQLERARCLALPPRNPLRQFRSWLTGEDVERAWSSLHAANQALVTVQDAATVRALVPDIYAAARAHLRAGDKRLIAFEEWFKRQRHDDLDLSPGDRQMLKLTRQAAESASDEANVNLRGFRNVLAVALLLLTLIVVALAFAALIRPALFNLCGPTAPTPTAAPSPSGETGRCPSGENNPSGKDVVHVEVLGAFGGAMAAVFTVSRMKGIGGPYSLPAMQALLKLPAGSATALLGVLLLQNGLVTGFLPQRSGVISAYAVIFGYAQQVVTRLVDRQAGNVQGPARSRNDPAKPPTIDPGTTTALQEQGEE